MSRDNILKSFLKALTGWLIAARTEFIFSDFIMRDFINAFLTEQTVAGEQNLQLLSLQRYSIIF